MDAKLQNTKYMINIVSNDCKRISKRNPHADSIRTIIINPDTDLPENCRPKPLNQIQHLGLGQAKLKGFADSENKIYIMTQNSKTPSEQQVGNGLYCTKNIFTASGEKFSGDITNRFIEIRDNIQEPNTVTISKKDYHCLIKAMVLDRFTSSPMLFNKICEMTESLLESVTSELHNGYINDTHKLNWSRPLPLNDILNIEPNTGVTKSDVFLFNLDISFKSKDPLYWCSTFEDSDTNHELYCEFQNPSDAILLEKLLSKSHSEIKPWSMYFRDISFAINDWGTIIHKYL